MKGTSDKVRRSKLLSHCKHVALLCVVLVGNTAKAFTSNFEHFSINLNTNNGISMNSNRRLSTSLKMSQNDDVTNRLFPLSAFTTTATPFENDMPNQLPLSNQKKFEIDGLGAIISSSLLITGNTVGAGTLLLPEVASAPGMLPSLGLFLGVYAIHLTSGLLIGELAIKQYEESESSTKTAPTSFQDLADDLLNFDGINGGAIVFSASIFINYCILSFALMRSGEIGMSLASILEQLPDISALSQNTCSVFFSAIIATLVSTQSKKTLSRVTSCAVSLLFMSFGPIIISGLANMQQDFITTLIAPGTFSSDSSQTMLDSVSTAAPIFVSSMMFQNIVPTVTKLLDYDRTKVMTTLAIGSSLPMLIYIAWCFAVMGGGVSLGTGVDAGMQSILLLIFSFACIGGSSLACVMSLAAEIQSQIENITRKGNVSVSPQSSIYPTKEETDYSVPSVAISVIPPLAAGLLFSNGEGMAMALQLAGSYASPIMYGILPVVLAWKQREVFAEAVSKQKDMVPGGVMSQMALGICATAFIASHLVSDICSML